MASISIDASGDSRQNNDSSDSDDEHLLPDFVDNFREFVADNDSEDGDLDDDLSDGGHGGDFSVPGNVAEEELVTVRFRTKTVKTPSFTVGQAKVKAIWRWTTRGLCLGPQ